MLVFLYEVYQARPETLRNSLINLLSKDTNMVFYLSCIIKFHA